MNWVSYAEDIEELRIENEHYRRGVDGLIDMLKENTSLAEIHRVEGDLRRLSDQLIQRYEEHKIHAEKQFQAALEFLRDPAVRVTEKLKKVTRERDEARVTLEKLKVELSQCRDSQARNIKRISQLGQEKLVLNKEVESLKDELSLSSAFQGIKPLKQK